MATHFHILALKISWMEEPGGLQVHGVSKSRTRLSDFTSLQGCLIVNSGTEFSGGGAKMAEEQDWETTFSPTNSSKEHLNAEQIQQNNF